MEYELEKLQKELNVISRMAVIENASNTERMLTIMVKLLKYRYGGSLQLNTPIKELKLAKSLCEYHHLSTGRQVEVMVNVEQHILSQYTIPFFSVLSWYFCAVDIMEMSGTDKSMIIENRVEEGMLEMKFIGDFRFQQLYTRYLEDTQSQDYALRDAMNFAKQESLCFTGRTMRVCIPMQ